MYKSEKTPAEWDKIKFKNNLGPQIGGLIHDAVALTIAEGKKEEYDYEVMKNRVKYWLNNLYEIAENKKKELTEIKPVSMEDANEQSEEFNKKVEQTVEEGRRKEQEDKLNFQP